MKKIFFALALIINSFSFAQQEIKLDVLDALAFKTIDLSYEFYIGEQSSIGISALFNLEKQRVDIKYNEKRIITPYFRHYFSSEKQWVFFGEAFIAISSGTKTIESTGNPTTFKDYTDGAFGVAVGYKYIASDNLTVDLHAGFGRNLFSSFSPVIVPRIGVNVGYRF